MNGISAINISTDNDINVSAPKTREYAHKYAERGLYVFPVWSCDHDTCTCSKGDACEHPGKHPKEIACPNGYKNSTIDHEIIDALFDDADNIGIDLEKSGLIAIDIDRRHNGIETWKRIVEENTGGRFQAGPIQLTGDQGFHVLYARPNVKRFVKSIGDGVDVKSNGYIVAEPSLHKTGNRYKWSEKSPLSDDYLIVDAPQWLVELVSKDEKSQPFQAETVTEGSRNNYLTSFAGSLRRKGIAGQELFEQVLIHNRYHCEPPLNESEVQSIVTSVSQMDQYGAYAPPENTSTFEPSLSYADELKLKPDTYLNAEYRQYLLDGAVRITNKTPLAATEVVDYIKSISTYLYAEKKKSLSEVLNKISDLHNKYAEEKIDAGILQSIVLDCIENINTQRKRKSIEIAKAHLEKPVETTPEPIDQTIVDDAIDILKNKSPIDYLMGEYNKIHVGDYQVGLMLLSSVGTQMCSNTSGIHPNLGGESGTGKSHAAKTIYHLLPDEYKFFSGISAKALFFKGLNPGTVIFMDDVNKLDDDLEQIIKVSITNYQDGYYHTYANPRKEGEDKTEVVYIPPRCSYWITSADNTFDMQVLNRAMMVTVDNSDTQDLHVMNHQKESAITGKYGFAVSREVKVCREIVKQLKSREPIEVVIPYAHEIEWRNQKNRRNLDMFFDTVRAFTAFYQDQRYRNSRGQVIANLDDYHLAAKLWAFMQREQVNKLTKPEYEIYSIILNHPEINYRDIVELSKKTNSAVSNIINGRRVNGNRVGGLLSKTALIVTERMIEGTRSKHYRIAKGAELNQFEHFESVVMLTDEPLARKHIAECINS